MITDLKGISERLATQDNRCTGEPLFIVQQEERIYGLDPQYSDSHYVWRDKDDWEYTYEDNKEAIDHHADCDPGFVEPPDEAWDEDEIGDRTLERIYYALRWEFVCAHFTEAAAETYVRQNAHRLKNPRIYVTSQYRCWEWIDVCSLLVRLEDPADHSVVQPRIDDAWLIWCSKYSGWWGPRRTGYTPNLLAAGIYTEEEARRQERAGREIDRAERLLDVIRKAVRPGTVGEALGLSGPHAAKEQAD